MRAAASGGDLQVAPQQRPKVYQTVGNMGNEHVAGVGINIGTRWTSDKSNALPIKAPIDQHSGAGVVIQQQQEAQR